MQSWRLFIVLIHHLAQHHLVLGRGVVLLSVCHHILFNGFLSILNSKSAWRSLLIVLRVPWLTPIPIAHLFQLLSLLLRDAVNMAPCVVGVWLADAAIPRVRYSVFHIQIIIGQFTDVGNGGWLLGVSGRSLVTWVAVATLSWQDDVGIAISLAGDLGPGVGIHSLDHAWPGSLIIHHFLLIFLKF